MSENIHQNHRQRMRDRAVREGFSSFADHELLEVLLYQSIPRVDTNPIAHALLKEFGTIKGVMDASVDDLCRVKGMGEKSAISFKLTVELMRRYEISTMKKTRTFTKMWQISEYLHPIFYGLGVEHLYMMMFNNGMELIECVKLSEGSVNATDVSIRKITELVITRRCSAVLLAHNHPNGVAIPSSGDLNFTEVLYAHLETLGISLVEHLIFAGLSYQPILRHQKGILRRSPITNCLDQDFYKKFYGDASAPYRITPYFHTPTEEELIEE